MNSENKSLYEIEGGKKEAGETPLLNRIFVAKNKKLKDLSIEDIRLLIGQNIGLKFLIPMALEILQHNILAEGDFYEGDLLKVVLSSEREFWEENSDLRKRLLTIIKDKKESVVEADVTKEIKATLLNLMMDFTNAEATNLG